MKKLASLWSFAFFTLAASQLVSNCGMDGAQTNKPVMTASASGGGHTAAAVSPTTQPVVAGSGADYANGATAMAATTDTSQTNRAGATAQAASASAFGTDPTEYRISQQDI